MTMDNQNNSVAQRKEFNTYCLAEIENNLSTIENLIPDESVPELDCSVVGTIMECAEQMEDLAMVYGYPGIESLAFNLASAMANFTQEKKHIPDDIGLRVKIAVGAIREIVRIDDESEEEKLIQEIMQTMVSSENTESFQEEKHPVAEDPPPAPKEKTPPIPAEFAELELFADDEPEEIRTKSGEPHVESKSSPQFEIKELDSLMKLVEEIENNKRQAEQSSISENPTQPAPEQPSVSNESIDNHSNSNPELEHKPDEATPQSSEEGDISFDLNLSNLAEKKSQRETQAREIEQVFNDIFKEETIENLDFLREALQKTRDEQTLGEAIMRIKESCGGLRDAANSFHVNDAMPTMALLDKLAKEQLSFNQVPDEDVLKAIIIAEKQIRSYIDQGKPQNFNFKPLDKILKNVLDSISEKTTSTGFDQLLDKNFDLEGTIKVVEEEKLLGKNTEPKKEEKKKVKVIFNEEDDRGRWMNKFK